jgi:hypothetical protein
MIGSDREREREREREDDDDVSQTYNNTHIERERGQNMR